MEQFDKDYYLALGYQDMMKKLAAEGEYAPGKIDTWLQDRKQRKIYTEIMKEGHGKYIADGGTLDFGTWHDHADQKMMREAVSKKAFEDSIERTGRSLESGGAERFLKRHKGKILGGAAVLGTGALLYGALKTPKQQELPQ